MNPQGMKKSIVSGILILAALLLMAGCASWNKAYHKYVMRGTILEATGKDVYLCIGSKDGAQVGQKFEVYKISRQPGSYTGKGGWIPYGTYTRYKTGNVKITEIVNEHFAKAIILSGTAHKDYIVELAYPLTCKCE
ncbi:MAG: hypothetical protein A2176_08100 [Spirochaetes bacterium RBG_13_51_14]|nr:MAG: hypothetical protein A2176_08100 [Spirochaetes bacterium RBG_13_51_14]